MKGSLLLYNLKLNCLIFSTSLNCSLIIFVWTYTVNNRNALDRLHVHYLVVLRSHFICVYFYCLIDSKCVRCCEAEAPCIGFSNLPEQLHRKAVKKGFDFTIMVVGMFFLLLMKQADFIFVIYVTDCPQYHDTKLN